MRRHESSGDHLGHVLVEDGHLSEHDLEQMLRLKAVESLYEVFTWEQGEFRFMDGVLPGFELVPIAVTISALVVDGLRRVDEWKQIREVIPNAETVPVAVAVLGTRIWPAWVFLDHIATVIVSVLILHAAFQIVARALRELIDVGASKEDREAMIGVALATRGVRAVHQLRTRYIGPGLQVDLHVLVDPELTVREGHDIAGSVKQRLLDQGPEVVDVLVHVEPYDAERLRAGTRIPEGAVRSP